MNPIFLVLGAFAAATTGVLIDWLLKLLLPEKPTLPHVIAGLAAIFVLVIVSVLPSIGTAIFQNDDTGGGEFFYPVRVLEKNTGKQIQHAQVTIEARNKAPLNEITDVNGFARFFIPSSYAGQPGRMIVNASEYEIYRKEIDLVEGILPDTIQLESVNIVTLESTEATIVQKATPTTPSSAKKWTMGRTLLNESFENGTKSKWYFFGGNWKVVQDENGNSALEGIAEANGDRVEVGSQDWHNYAFEVKTRVLEESTADHGETFDLIFRAAGECERYKWNMNRTFTNMGRENPPNCKWHQFQVDSYEPLSKDWILIRIEVLENTIIGYINGIRMVEIVDDHPVTSGRVGFSISADSKVWFDDVRVVEMIYQ